MKEKRRDKKIKIRLLDVIIIRIRVRPELKTKIH